MTTFSKAIKQLLYNSSLEIIDCLNNSSESNDDETKTDDTAVKTKKFVGKNKLGKVWDTLQNRVDAKPLKGFAKPVNINKEMIEFIINKVKTKTIPEILAGQKKLIYKYTSREFGLNKDIKKGLKDSDISVETLIIYIKFIAFIGASIAYESGKKYSLGKEVVNTIEMLMMH